jgi:hypothetical protein
MLSYTVPPDVSYLGAICLVMNPQSIGVSSLESIVVTMLIYPRSVRLLPSSLPTPRSHLSLIRNSSLIPTTVA